MEAVDSIRDNRRLRLVKLTYSGRVGALGTARSILTKAVIVMAENHSEENRYGCKVNRCTQTKTVEPSLAGNSNTAILNPVDTSMKASAPRRRKEPAR
jgi:hypothetical protein